MNKRFIIDGRRYDLLNADSRDIWIPILVEHKDRNIIVVSDPPFNIGYKYKNYKDRMSEADYYDMIYFFFNALPSVIIHYPEESFKIAARIQKIPERVVSWVYNSNTQKQHRDILFFDVKPDFTAVTQPYKNPNDKRIQKLIASGRTGSKLYDWWEVNQVKNVSKEKTAHPCQMPLEVMNRTIGLLPRDALIIDPFNGSGTTGLAVLEMNKKQGAARDFIGIEIDPDYSNIAAERMEARAGEIRKQENNS